LFQQTGATARWVRGHSNDPFNDKCDKLAKAARDAARISSGIALKPRKQRLTKRERKTKDRKRILLKEFKSNGVEFTGS
jgi:ribonuclease HI